MITITDNAVNKIRDVIIDDNTENAKLRVFVQGGGCSGMSYGFAIDTEVTEEDFVIVKEDISVLIDATSSQYLTDATIDYRDDVMGSQFVITNPNATTTCGCGSSFSVY